MPEEAQVTESQGEKKRGGGTILIWAFLGLFVLLAFLGIINAFRHNDNSKGKAAAATTPTVPPSSKAPPPSMPGRAAAEVKQMEDDDKRTATTAATGSAQQGQGGQQQQPADPKIEIERRRLLAVGLSPGWVKGPDVASATLQQLPERPIDSDVMDAIISKAGVPGGATPVADKPGMPHGHFAEKDPDSYVGPDGTVFYAVRPASIMDAVLENKLVGEFAGPVRCHTTDDFKSDDGRVLIPAGSVFIGEATAVGSQYQRRLAVLFTDLQLPGWQVDLGRAIGLDQEGATALKDKVNNHIPSTIATVAAIGILGGLAQANSGTTLNQGGLQRVYGGIGAEAGQEGSIILNRKLQQLPEIVIRPGDRVRIWISQRLWIPEQGK